MGVWAAISHMRILILALPRETKYVSQAKKILARTQKTCEGELLLVHVARGAGVGLDVGRESLLDLDDVPASTVEHHTLVLGRAVAKRRGMRIKNDSW